MWFPHKLSSLGIKQRKKYNNYYFYFIFKCTYIISYIQIYLLYIKIKKCTDEKNRKLQSKPKSFSLSAWGLFKKNRNFSLQHAYYLTLKAKGFTFKWPKNSPPNGVIQKNINFFFYTFLASKTTRY